MYLAYVFYFPFVSPIFRATPRPFPSSRQFHDAIPLRRPLSIHYLFHLLFSPFPPPPKFHFSLKKQVRRSFSKLDN